MRIRITYKGVLSFVLLLIVLKPLFDLAWRWPLFYFSTFPMTLQRLIVIVVVTLLTLVLLLRIFFFMRIKLNRTFFIIMLFFLSLFAIFLNTSAIAINDFIRFYGFIILYITSPLFFNGDDVRFYKFLKWMVLITLIPTFVSYLQLLGIVPYSYFDSYGFQGYMGRITGGYKHPAGYTDYLLVALPILFFLFFNKQVGKKIFYFWLLTTLPMVFLTTHRATIIISLFQIFTFVYFYRKKYTKYFILLLFICGVGYFFLRFGHFFVKGSVSDRGFTFRGRTKIWGMVLDVFKNKPLFYQVFGTGSSNVNGIYFDFHSGWLRILYVYGYLGLLLFLGWGTYMLVLSGNDFLRRKCDYRDISLVVIILIFTWMLYSVTMLPLKYSNFSWWFALFLGYYIHRRKIRKSKQ